MQTINSVSRKECTGCGTCINICPAEAISMQENNEGFLYPVIDEDKCTNCGLCAKRCPILSERKNTNKKNPECYAVMATDEIRSMSSSGGMFTLIADYILEQGGYVCGAAYNNDWSVSHIIVDNKEDVSKLRGSKYLQSNTEKCYTEIKKLLKNNKKVLFTGCPCQVAGLYGYLGKDYENLLTMELLCHGTPSYKTFKKYLDETFPEADIERIEFRDKSLNWCSSNIMIYHSSGEISVMNVKDDPYEKGFHRGLFNRESCAPCKFARLPRQADFTVADWWGIHKIKPEYDDKKGTSLVLTNNPKAEKTFLTIKTNMKKVCQIPLKDAKSSVNVTIYRPLKHNQGRNNYFKSIDNIPFLKNVESSLTNSYDVGILGLWNGNNYGCILTGYALYRTIQDMGYSTAFITKKKKKITHSTMVSRFFPKINIVEVEKNNTNRLNDYFKTFVVGSDQVWNYSLCLQWSSFFLLDFAQSNKLKLSYASSIGNDFTNCKNEKNKFICSYLLKKFDNISVREDYAVPILKNELNVEAKQLLDPVFICDPKIYDELASNSQIKTEEDYIFAYILDPSPEKNAILEYSAKQLGKKLYVATDATNNSKKKLLITQGTVTDEIDLEDWLRYYRDAKYIITDSFHGTCFSIIFKKQFISIGNIGRGIKRFESLLRGFELIDRLFITLKELKSKNLFNKEINYEKVYEIINSKKEEALIWLKYSLNIKKENSLSDFDIYRELFPIYLHSEHYYKFKYRGYKLLQNLVWGSLRKDIKEKKLKYKNKLRLFRQYSGLLLHK